MKTRLKPYDHVRYSPHPWPPEVGQLVILLDEPRGYAGILISISEDKNRGKVSLLDAKDEVMEFSLSSLLPTGKTPKDLILQYEVDSVQLSHNLEIERSIPDFSRLKKYNKKGGGGKKKPKVLTEANKMFLAKLIKDALKKKGG